LRKALADPHGQRVFNLSRDLMGAGGMLQEGPPDDPHRDGPGADGWEQWARGFLFSPALTVGGGTSEVLRNVIAERLLGLPHDPDTEADKTWAEARRGAGISG
jgi:alkylation response protein AidB-like acyl-CoA dehydrogenase